MKTSLESFVHDFQVFLKTNISLVLNNELHNSIVQKLLKLFPNTIEILEHKIRLNVYDF